MRWRGGVTCPPSPCSQGPPTTSWTVGFPPSGADLGQPPGGRLPSEREASSAAPHPHPIAPMVNFPRTRHGAPALTGPGTPGSGHGAQRPWARSRCDLLCRPGVGPRSVGLSPPRSALVRTPASSLHPAPPPAVGPSDSWVWCRWLSAPAGRRSCPAVAGCAFWRLRAWPPTPAASWRASTVSSATTAACPACGPGQRPAIPVHSDFPLRLPWFEAAVMHACAGPPIGSPPRSLLPRYGHVRGPLWVLRPSLSWCVPSHASARLAAKSGD